MPLNIYLTVGKRLPNAASATIAVYKASDDSAVSLSSSACTETDIESFSWSTSLLAAQPTVRTEYYYTITPDVGTAKQGRFTLLTYADILIVKRLLRSELNAVKIGIVNDRTAETPYDISEDDMTEFMREADAYLDAVLKDYYSVPLALTDMATKRIVQRVAGLLSANFIYQAMRPNVSKEEMSEVVRGWQKQADEFLAAIKAGTITLDGETESITNASENYPLFSQPQILFDEVGNESTTGLIADGDVGTN